MNLCPVESLNNNLLKKPSSTTKWKISSTALKRLDDLYHNWGFRPPTLRQLPDVFLERTSLFIDRDISIDNWMWKDKSKCFPLIDAVSHQNPSMPDQRRRKIKVYLDVIERLTFMESMCRQPTKVKQRIEKRYTDLVQEYGTEIDIMDDKPLVANHRFLPKRDLDNFKKIQDILMNTNKQTTTSSQEKRRFCELDNTRLQFD